MTRLYTEADVRAMLEETAKYVDSAAGRTMLDTTAARIAARILSTATPVAAPDLSRLAEAVKWEALYIIGAQSVGTSVTAAEAVRAIDQAVRSLDLAPIIAASGTSEAVVRPRECYECPHFPAELSQDEGGLCALGVVATGDRRPPDECPLPKRLRTPRKEQKR